MFKTGGRTVLIIQNASSSDRRFDPVDGGRLPAPASVEILATPNLDDQEERAAVVQNASASGPSTLPALSVTRVVWTGDVAVVGAE